MDFSSYRLPALRDFARELGIKHPTTYKRADLISEITQALKNERGDIPSKRGRRVLLNNIEGVEAVLGKEYVSEINFATERYLSEIDKITEKYKQILHKNV